MSRLPAIDSCLKRFLLGPFLCCLLSVCGYACAADVADIFVIGPDQNDAAQRYLSELRKTLRAEPAGSALDRATVTFIPLGNETALPAGKKPILICLGEKALRSACHGRPSAMTMAVFVPRQALDNYKTQFPDTTISGIYLDAPPLRQVRLASMLLPKASRAAILSSAPDKQAARSIEGHTVTTYSLPFYDSLARMLSEAVEENDYLLGTPDSQIFNGQEIRQILLTAYRHSRVLIGPSVAFVNAGGLATTYSTPEDYSKQTALLIERFLTHSTIPALEYPAYYAVAVNSQVAKSLDLIVPDADVLEQRLRQLEASP